MIKIKWFGHSMWKISNEKVSIITDPFTNIGYPMPKNETADIVISSHDHFDHNNFSLVKGNPEIIKAEGEFDVNGVHFKMFPEWHDENLGKDRGQILLMKFNLDGKNFLHCGDLGRMLPDKTIAELGKVDVIFIPVGGYYTIDAKTAKAIVDKLNPSIVFPMHFKTSVLDFPIAKVDEYLQLIDNYRKIDGNTIVLSENDFQTDQTILLDYE